MLAAEPRPLPAITLAEVLATSDLPGGVVNILTGRGRRDRRPGWPSHMDVNALDLTGVDDAGLAAELERRRPRTSSGWCGRGRATSPRIRGCSR